MADDQKKSRKLSGGKARPPKNFQIYLDENLCNCQAILNVLNNHGVQVHSHLTHFKPGTPDREWLQFVGAKKLALLTTDKSFRYNAIEKECLVTYNIQSFEFTGNNKGAAAMAVTLDNALPKMMKLKRRRRKYFVASVGPSGQIRVMWDSKLQKKNQKTHQKSK